MVISAYFVGGQRVGESAVVLRRVSQIKMVGFQVMPQSY